MEDSRSGNHDARDGPPPRQELALSTGFPGADAERAFTRERRRQALARVAARFRAQPDDATLPFDPVIDALGRRGERDLGVQTIPVGAVVGYHSNRRRPSPGAIRTVAPLYRRLVEEERRHPSAKAAVAASSRLLDELVAAEAGSYEEFVWSVIARAER